MSCVSISILQFGHFVFDLLAHPFYLTPQKRGHVPLTKGKLPVG